MKLALLVFSLLIINHARADEFSDLKAKKIEAIVKDPFANRKFRCETTLESGLKITENWLFFKTEPGSFLRMLGGITKKGTYTVADNVLNLQESISITSMGKELPSDKSWSYKYKLTKLGFEYIHEANDKKLLYECIISGSTVR